MKKPKRKKSEFFVGQVVAIRKMQGMFRWGQITKIYSTEVELDNYLNRLFQFNVIRPLTPKEIGPRGKRGR